MDIEVSGATPVVERPRQVRGAVLLALAVAAGAAFGWSAATMRQPLRGIGDDQAQHSAAVAAPTRGPSADAGPPGLPGPLRERMLQRVREYNKAEPDAVEVGDVRLMSGLRDNLTRLDDPRSYPPGDYRLEVTCLGEGQVWALLRVGDDEAVTDMDCHDEHVLVSQLLLTAHADGRRTVTLVCDAPLGLAVGFQVLRRR